VSRFIERLYYVYILTNRSGTLYVGMTNDLLRRLLEHREAKPGTFTGRYKLDRLLYFEDTPDVSVAIAREKQLKGWTRARKLALIREMNPFWRDLSEDLLGPT
jgi:putative endonuclease